jgi:phosphotransferase system  glucose/maltose/N-acetylglucosamine-specific IIC component
MVLLALILLFSGILPLKYLSYALGGLVALSLFFGLALKSKRGDRKPAKSFLSFVALLISVLFFIASFVIIDVMYQLFGVFSTGHETETISVVVLADSDTDTLTALKNTTFGFSNLPLTEESNTSAVSELKISSAKIFQ